MNCGAIPKNLLEAEFFGARKGILHRASQRPRRLLPGRTRGHLFLDEIGDLPLAMQSGCCAPSRSAACGRSAPPQEETVDVRIVSATHRDLAADVQASRFRQDLYYRLNVIEIVIPPLRERRRSARCAALLTRIANESGMPVPPAHRPRTGTPSPPTR